MLKRIEEVLIKEKSKVVTIYGDINGTLASTLTFVKLGISVTHAEAELHSR